jgi:hypothetical protein
MKYLGLLILLTSCVTVAPDPVYDSSKIKVKPVEQGNVQIIKPIILKPIIIKPNVKSY